MAPKLLRGHGMVVDNTFFVMRGILALIVQSSPLDSGTARPAAGQLYNKLSATLLVAAFSTICAINFLAAYTNLPPVGGRVAY